jgi:signal transduction histidine kinase
VTRVSALRDLADDALYAVRRWLSRLRGPAAVAQMDPGERMFTRIRWRMTLLYSAVLAAILIVSGLLLYLGMQRQLLDPVTSELQVQAQQLAREWQPGGFPPPQCLSSAESHEPAQYLVACFDANGNLLSANQFASVTSGFLSPTAARSVIANPAQPRLESADVSVSAGDQSIEFTAARYTAAVRDPVSGQTVGVLQIGLNITPEVQALETLVRLLLLVGALTLVGCAFGGALLAARTLAPARLAFDRQQKFIADASHELRTPLTLLRADAEVLLRGRDRLEPEDAPLLDDIITEVEHMGALAENLLTLARLDNSAYHLEQEVVDLDALMAEVAHRVRSLADEREVRLEVARAQGVQSDEQRTLVIGDPTQLREVILILVDNAIKYNRPGGSVTLRVSREGTQAVLEVRDTGIGIAPEHLAHLGERFYRVDKARSRQMGGAGLGIAIARSIARAHHGSLTLASVPDQGTTATLRLPAAQHTAEPA